MYEIWKIQTSFIEGRNVRRILFVTYDIAKDLYW